MSNPARVSYQLIKVSLRQLAWIAFVALAAGCFQSYGSAVQPTTVDLTSLAPLISPTALVAPVPVQPTAPSNLPTTAPPVQPTAVQQVQVVPTNPPIFDTNLPTEQAQPSLTFPTPIPPGVLVTPTTNNSLPPTPTALPTDSACQHTVQQGEWLYAIARKYSINPAELLSANPQLPSPDALKPGDVLSIPNCNKGNAAAPAAPAQPQSTLNPVTNPTTDPATGGVAPPVQPIQPEQATVIPPNSAAPTPIRLSGRVYTVAAGDTLGTIARKFNVTVQAIKQANDMTNDFLSVGQKLKIPEPVQ